MALFDWLGKWFNKRAEDSVEIYKPKERRLYSYWNGTKQVEADPMVIYKKMMAVAPELHIDIKVAESKSKDAGKAHNSMINHIRNIFSLKPFEDGGLTEIESILLFDHFTTYCGFVKKNTNPSVTSSNNSEESNSTSNDDLATLRSSGFGSTADVLSSVEQKSSPPEPPSEPDL